MESVETSANVNVLEKQNVELPKKYNVILFNDDITPMGFVTGILENIFNMSKKDAIALMLKIHTEGRGIAGTYIKSIAEWKVNLVKNVAKTAEYPLEVAMEKE